MFCLIHCACLPDGNMANSDASTSWNTRVESGSERDSEVFQQHILQDPLLGAGIFDCSGIGKSLLNNNEDMEEDGNSSFLNSTIVGANTPQRQGSLKRALGQIQTNEDITNVKKSNIYILKNTGANLADKSQVKLKNFFLKLDPSLSQESIKAHNGYLTIKVVNSELKEKLLKIKKILGTEVTVTNNTNPNRQSVSVIQDNRVIIFGVPLNISTEEIKDETNCSGVMRLEKKKLNDNEPKPSSCPVVLAFVESPPTEVFIGLQRYKTKIYIPNPTRCYKCQRFGHIAQSCRAKARCPRCSNEHEFGLCPLSSQDATITISNLKCPNCNGNHSAAFRGCPSYVTAKEITTVKVVNKVTYAEAAKMISSNKAQHFPIIAVSSSGNILVKNALNINQPLVPPVPSYAAPLPTCSVSDFRPQCDTNVLANMNFDLLSNPPSVQQPDQQNAKSMQSISNFFNTLLQIIQSPNLSIFCNALNHFIVEYLNKVIVNQSSNQNSNDGV